MNDPSTTEGCDYIIITNSPGELSAWVYPVGRRIRKEDPQGRIVILLVPCFYATGREKEIASGFEFADIVLSPSDFIKISLGIALSNYQKRECGIVLSLGGDPWHSVLISRKLGFPAAMYTMKKAETAPKFKHIFAIHNKLKTQLIKLGVKEAVISVAGDLMQDSVRPEMTPENALIKWNILPDEQLVTFFPGSRLSHVQESLPVFMTVCDQIKKELPKTKFIICLSPFVKLEDIEKLIKPKKHYHFEPSWGKLTGEMIETSQGTEIKIAKTNRFDLISISDLVITIPGTNTAEIASLGKPMIVCYTWKAKIPSGGIGFFLNALPLEGLFKKLLMKIMYSRIKFKALPNALAEKEITPEIGVEKTAGEITSVAISLLNDKERRERITQELLQIMGGGGAAEKIAKKTIEIAKETVRK